MLHREIIRKKKEGRPVTSTVVWRGNSSSLDHVATERLWRHEVDRAVLEAGEREGRGVLSLSAFH